MGLEVSRQGCIRYAIITSQIQIGQAGLKKATQIGQIVAGVKVTKGFLQCMTVCFRLFKLGNQFGLYDSVFHGWELMNDQICQCQFKMGEETRGWSGLVNPNILVGRLDEMKLSFTSRTQAQI